MNAFIMKLLSQNTTDQQRQHRTVNRERVHGVSLGYVYYGRVIVSLLHRCYILDRCVYVHVVSVCGSNEDENGKLFEEKIEVVRSEAEDQVVVSQMLRC